MNRNNIFMEHIYRSLREKYWIVAKLKTILFIRKLNKVSPDFDLLWDIVSMLYTLEVVFLYSNKPHDILHFIEVKPNKGNIACFGLNVNNFEITFHLTYKSDNDKTIKIDIADVSDNKRIVKKTFEFKDRDPSVIKDIHDEQLFMNINDWLMDAVCDLVRRYSKWR